VRVPTSNENFKLLKDHHHLTVQTIKCASQFAVGLFSDGNLYAWGLNNGGAMGIAKQLGHITDEQALLPTPVCNDSFKG